MNADQAVLDEFERRLVRLWRRDAIAVDDPDGTARLIRLLIEEYGTSSEAAGYVLATTTGIRDQWNERFAADRARQLAGWVVPHLVPPVLDVLGGDFSVSSALVAHGIRPDQVIGCERLGAYGLDTSHLPFECRDLGTSLDLPDAPGGTALISAVLHHEPALEPLLESVAATTTRRWVALENCIDANNTPAFHLFMDEFFNRCLNHIDVPCVPQHRCRDDWRRLLGRYGTVVHEEHHPDVPGIPFPYRLFVVDR